MKTKSLEVNRMQLRSPLTADPSFRNRTTGTPQLPIVLLVEEDVGTRALLRGALAEECHLLEVNDGSQALELARKALPDLVIADLATRAGEGTLCQQLIQDDETNHIAMVLLTPGHTEEDRIRALEAGAVAHLGKPISLPILRLWIHNLLELRKKQQQRLEPSAENSQAASAAKSTDKQFLKRAISMAQHHMGEAGFNAARLAQALAMSRSSLYRKIHEVSGRSVNLFVRDLRIERAAQLLRNHQMSISEVAYQVGFQEPSYFTRCFRQRFGQSPSDYRQQPPKA